MRTIQEIISAEYYSWDQEGKSYLKGYAYVFQIRLIDQIINSIKQHADVIHVSRSNHGQGKILRWYSFR